MYISQVTFESDLEHREMIEGLMQSKKDAIEAAELVISSEVWWKKTAGLSVSSLLENGIKKRIFKPG